MSMQRSSNFGTNWSMGAALGAALGASACCTIPLALVSLGVGGAWIGSLTALAPYRWFFISIALGTLGYAGYDEWRLSRQPDCDCETIFSSSVRRALLGIGALAVLVLIVSPWWVASSPGAAPPQTGVVATGEEQPDTPASFRQVVLEIEGMTCAACSQTVRTALKEVDGVYRVKATYEPPEAVVRFDPEAVAVEALTRAIEQAGFSSRQTSSP